MSDKQQQILQKIESGEATKADVASFASSASPDDLANASSAALVAFRSAVTEMEMSDQKADAFERIAARATVLQALYEKQKR